MKNFLHFLGKISMALAMSFTVFVAHAQAPFVCQDGVSYIYKTNALFRVSLVPTYSETSIGNVRTAANVNIPVDAIGYNVVDNFIYGFEPGTTNVVKISSTGVAERLPVTSGLPTTAANRQFTAGDIDASGNLFLYTSGATSMYKINLNASPLVATAITGTAGTFNDLSVNDAGTQVYGYSGNNLIVRTIAGTTYTQTSTASNMGSTIQNTFYDKYDRLFAQKTNGEIYMVAPGTLVTTDGMVKLGGNNPPSTSDGAHCRNASVYSESQPSFDCNEGRAYFITHGPNGACADLNTNTNLAIINTQNFSSTSLTNITNSIRAGLINAIGFNPLDGYIWGYRFGTGQLARIGSDGSVQYFGISGLPWMCGGTEQTAVGAGDITTDGIYYGYQGNRATGAKVLYKIDLNPASATYLQILGTFDITTTTSISDIAFNPVDKNFYGVSGGSVYQINSTNGALTNLGGSGFTGGSVATFCDPEGNFYFQASGGPLYKIAKVHSSTSTMAATVASSTAVIGAGNGDAARCPLTFFSGITLSGNIWNDVNGNRIKAGGEVNTVTNDPSQQLTVYLLNDANVIVGKADVNADGTWQMPSIPVGTYTLSLSNDASHAISTPGSAIVQNLPDDWVHTGVNFGTPGSAGSWSGQVTVSASDASKSNLDFGIQQLPTAGNGTSSGVNIPGNVSVNVPLTTFTNTNPSSDASTGTVTSIAITAIPEGATSITINGTKYGDGGAAIPAGGVVISTDANGLPVAGTTISVDPTADGATTVTIPFVAIDNAGARSVNTGVEGTAVLNLTAAPITISGTVWNDANGTAIKEGTEPFTNAGGLFANLVTPAGVVLQSVPVDPATGLYNFTNVPPNTQYNVILTKDDKTGVTNLTTSDLPSGWVHTGVNQDGTSNTGNTSGIIGINAGATPITNQNFGIEQTPTAYSVTNDPSPGSDFSETPPAGFSPVSGYLSIPYTTLDPLAGTDPEDGSLNPAGNTVIIGTVSSNTLLYYDFGPANGGVKLVEPGTTIPNFVPGNLVFYGQIGSGDTTPFGFTYQLVDAAGEPSNVAPYVFSTNSALPVTLISFTAKKGEGHTARLEWTTTAETNSKQFEVEHSINGKNWNLVGTVAAKGESKEMVVYRYVHTTPNNGENLYRLRMVDRDESFVYSKINSLNFTIALKATVYPNPTSEKLKISLDGIDESNISKVSVLTQDGKSVYVTTQLTNSEIDVRNLASGTYIILITLKNGVTQNAKVLISR